MTNIIFSKKIQLNDEDLVLEVTQSENGAEIRIEGTEIAVTVNGNICYDNLVKEEYRYLPSKPLREFVFKHGFNFLGFEDVSPSFCIYINGVEYNCLIKQEKQEFTLYMYDWMTSIEKIARYNTVSEEDKTATNSKLDKLKSDCNSKGYPLIFSHEGDMYDNVYVLRVPLSKFDGDAVLDCTTAWQKYNNDTVQFIN